MKKIRMSIISRYMKRNKRTGKNRFFFRCSLQICIIMEIDRYRGDRDEKNLGNPAVMLFRFFGSMQ